MKAESSSILDMAMGAIKERVDYEMGHVIDNILDPNTNPTKKRKMVLTLELTPDSERRTIQVACTAKSTLVATNPVSTSLYVGAAPGTGLAQAVNTISKMDDAEEIMVEYRKCLDMSKAIGIVQDRNQRIEEERKVAEARKAAMEAQRAAVEKVAAAAPPPPIMEAPVQAPVPQEADEKVYKCSFTVRATKAQLKKLKEFMIQEGIRYE